MADVALSLFVIGLAIVFVLKRDRIAAAASEISRATGGSPWSGRAMKINSIIMLVLGIAITAVVLAALLFG